VKCGHFTENSSFFFIFEKDKQMKAENKERYIQMRKLYQKGNVISQYWI
jgi:hypothetical protein